MRYVWDGEDFVPADERKRAPNPKRSDLAFPMIITDTPAFKSPIDGKIVEGRVARKEHMKRHGVREVDPGEFTPTYHNPKRKHLNRD